MKFYLKNTAIFQGVRIKRLPFFGQSTFFKKAFGILTVVLLLVLLVSAFDKRFEKSLLEKIFAVSLLTGAGFLFFFELDLFLKNKVFRPETKISLRECFSTGECNLAGFFDITAAEIIWKGERFSLKKRFKNFSEDILLYFVLNSKTPIIKFVFGRAGLDLNGFLKQLKTKIFQEKEVWHLEAENILEQAVKISLTRGKERVGVGDILIALSAKGIFEEYLTLNELKAKDIENLVQWYETINEKIAKRKKFYLMENLLQHKGIGRDWAHGYTVTLDAFSLDLTKLIEKRGVRDVIGHHQEIERVERILAGQNVNNVLIVGEQGTGRKSIVEAVAQKAFLGVSLPEINYKRFLMFDIGRVISSIPSLKEAEMLIEQCFSEAVQAGNVILIINEIHNFLNFSGGEGGKNVGALNIAPLLLRYLPRDDFRVVAITTYHYLHTVLEKNPAVLGYFEKVSAEEISENETLQLLEMLLPYFERKYNKFINYKALREIVSLCAQYIQDAPFPEKAVRTLDEAMMFLAERKEKILMPEHVRHLLSQKTELPLEEMAYREQQILLNLESLIHERIIDQETAVKEVSSALRRVRSGIRIKRGPIGSFLFLGPTGVGKTETAKALSDIYFGSEKRMIRLDMSEFQNIQDIKRLLGEAGEEGLLTTPVRENPFSLLLLDEIEKAHPNILNLFLQILDEGWVTSGEGRKVSFKNTMIIATSNAGSEFIRNKIKEGEDIENLKGELLEYLLSHKIFRPEFINRFDGVVVFKPLTEQDLLGIAGLMLKTLASHLRDKGIYFEITKELKQKIVELGYSVEFGARQMRRVIQEKVENLLATSLLSGKIKRGDKIKIKVVNGEFILEILEKEKY